MFKQTFTLTHSLSFKWLFIGLITYIAFTSVGAAIMIGVWLGYQSDPSLNPQDLALAAQQDPLIVLFSGILGSTGALISGMLVTRRKLAFSYHNGLAMGGILMLYGVISMILHPEHSLVQQSLKILAPMPLCLAGGWLRKSLFKTTAKPSLRHNHN